MSATEAPPSGSSAASPAPPTPDPGRPRRRAVAFLAVALASLAAFVVLTWPLARHLDGIWTAYGKPDSGDSPAARYQPDMLLGGDHLQNVFIQSVIVDNLRARRSPYLDLREGAAGPAPLKTTCPGRPCWPSPGRWSG